MEKVVIIAGENGTSIITAYMYESCICYRQSVNSVISLTGNFRYYLKYLITLIAGNISPAYMI